jgi:hypothetical protein
MNSPRLLSLSLFSAGFALSLATARADDPSYPPVPPPAPANQATSPADGSTPPPAPPHRRRMHAAFVLGELTAKLGLTADQQKAVGAIIADADGQLKALRQDDSIAREDKRPRMKAIVDAERGQIRAALTPSQQATFDAMPRGGQRAAPTPAPTT